MLFIFLKSGNIISWLFSREKFVRLGKSDSYQSSMPVSQFLLADKDYKKVRFFRLKSFFILQLFIVSFLTCFNYPIYSPIAETDNLYSFDSSLILEGSLAIFVSLKLSSFNFLHFFRSSGKVFISVREQSKNYSY